MAYDPEQGLMIWYRRFRTMEAAANKLQAEAKGYLDSIRGIWLSHVPDLTSKLKTLTWCYMQL